MCSLHVVVLRQTEGAAVGELQHGHAEALVLVAQAQLDLSAAQGRGLVVGEQGGRLLPGPGGTTEEDQTHRKSDRARRKSGKTHRKSEDKHRKSEKTHRK